MFLFWKDFNEWPKVDTCEEVQQFIDTMCEEYQVPAIKVIIRSTSWVEWFAGKDVIAFSFWPHEGEEDADFGRYIVYLTGKNAEFLVTRNPRKNTAQMPNCKRTTPLSMNLFTIISIIMKESIVRIMEENLDRWRKNECSIWYFFFYENNYAKYFHNFWGFPFGKVDQMQLAEVGSEVKI